MRWFLILLLLAVSAGGRADTLNTQLEDGGVSFTGELTPGSVRYHYSEVNSDLSLDNAVDVSRCKGGLDIFLNPDFDGTATTATYALFNCPRATASASYANECIGANFDPDGGGADTNIMTNSNDSLQLWGLTVRFFGATFTNGTPDQAQVILICNGK